PGVAAPFHILHFAVVVRNVGHCAVRGRHETIAGAARSSAGSHVAGELIPAVGYPEYGWIFRVRAIRKSWVGLVGSVKRVGILVVRKDSGHFSWVLVVIDGGSGEHSQVRIEYVSRFRGVFQIEAVSD